MISLQQYLKQNKPKSTFPTATELSNIDNIITLNKYMANVEKMYDINIMDYSTKSNMSKELLKRINLYLSNIFSLASRGMYFNDVSLSKLPKSYAKQISEKCDSIFANISLIGKVCDEKELIFIPGHYVKDINSSLRTSSYYILTTICRLNVKAVMNDPNHKSYFGSYEMLFNNLTITLPILRNAQPEQQRESICAVEKQLSNVKSKSDEGIYAVFTTDNKCENFTYVSSWASSVKGLTFEETKKVQKTKPVQNDTTKKPMLYKGIVISTNTDGQFTAKGLPNPYKTLVGIQSAIRAMLKKLEK